MKSHADSHLVLDAIDHRMTRAAHRACALAILAAAVIAGACDPGLAHSSVAPIARGVLVFVDRSRSIDPTQFERWNSLAASRLIWPNTRVTVLTIDDVTIGAAQVAEVKLPLPDRRAGWDELQATRERLRVAELEVRAAFAKAMTPGQGAWTDILSAIDRAAERRPDGTTTLVWFTDAVHSTPELDLETTSPPAKVAALAKTRGWTRRTLNGARVHIVLTSMASGARAARNDRKTLQRFWAAVIAEAGGELASFGPDLTVGKEA